MIHSYKGVGRGCVVCSDTPERTNERERRKEEIYTVSPIIRLTCSGLLVMVKARDAWRRRHVIIRRGKGDGVVPLHTLANRG